MVASTECTKINDKSQESSTQKKIKKDYLYILVSENTEYCTLHKGIFRLDVIFYDSMFICTMEFWFLVVRAVGSEEVEQVGQQQGGAGEVGGAYHHQLPAPKATIPGQSDTTNHMYMRTIKHGALQAS